MTNRAEPTAPPARPAADGFAAAVADLAGRVAGPVFRPGEEGYDSERSGFQTGLRHEPAVIVGARGAADVRAAVAFAVAQGLPVGVQATGHGLPAAAADGVLISTRRMTGVRVDARNRTVRFEAGVRWEQIVPEAAGHGLAPLSGSAPHVGAVSYTLGGGLGLLSRRFGYAADHVRRIEVVTADARLRTVTPDQEPDLFWALRGGAANFGVVTAMEVDLFPVSRVYGGRLVFDAPLPEDVLGAYARWTRTVPEELSSSVGLLAFPDDPEVPEPFRGRYTAHVRIAYTGDPAEGERLVAPLRALGPRLLDDLRDMPYSESHTIYTDPTRPHPYRGDNALLRELDAGQLREVLALTGPGARIRCVLQVRHLGGALGRPPAVPNAVGHRDARYLLSALAIPGEGGVAELRAVQRQVFRAVAPATVGRSLNFLYGVGGPDDAEPGDGAGAAARGLYEPADLRRLTELKERYDPAGTFRLTYRVPPAG
ncbi:FAD-binding oxidoreductase [Streptomyces sp. NPDC018031]|uniref:FAD-binding oxidoreductase n=1 Tax=Streptomyces sp. NPDC018031 TaxID=3365033 RepID=UPI0037BCAF98